ncbi:MAG: hypothetical protein HC845_09205, partial [Akkermansiaceae bacterium]|nr:hypothetical protein [Akkermansiaceae bacterium]
MKTPTSTSVFLLLAITGLAMGDVPKKAPLSRYTKLWTDSPFTTKPPPPEMAPTVNPLEDYALLGVSPLGGNGYRVTITNKKNPDGVRVFVETNKENPSEFKVLEVIRKPGDPMGTTVLMSSGGINGTVSFDPNTLAINNPTVNPNQIPQSTLNPNQPNTIPQPPPPNGENPVRQPRPRVISPPVPQQPVPQGVQGQPAAARPRIVPPGQGQPAAPQQP